MSLRTVFSMLALTVVGSLSIAACAAPTDEATDPQEDPAASQDEELRLTKYNSCNLDSECVATPEPGCCPSGRKVALNKTKVAGYVAANTCRAQQVCPGFRVRDERIAQCNTANKKCEMILREDVKCGGFTRNPHKCTTGYTCESNGMHPDTFGKCTWNP